MDDIVKAALKKWPNVPHCYGWLGLDARGDWYLRDEAAQAAGVFPQSKGSRVVHDKLKDFMGRNYDHDERGAWFFQNGPQRVYVELESAPWILGVHRDSAGGFLVSTHTGHAVSAIQSAWLDEAGRLFLSFDSGLGLVRSLDMDVAADALSADLWPLQERSFAELTRQFKFQLHPTPTA